MPLIEAPHFDSVRLIETHGWYRPGLGMFCISSTTVPQLGEILQMTAIEEWIVKYWSIAFSVLQTQPQRCEPSSAPPKVLIPRESLRTFKCTISKNECRVSDEASIPYAAMFESDTGCRNQHRNTLPELVGHTWLY
jgi:hypothetical protein